MRDLEDQYESQKAVHSESQELLTRRERESEEEGNLMRMLRSDLDRLQAERWVRAGNIERGEEGGGGG